MNEAYDLVIERTDEGYGISSVDKKDTFRKSAMIDGLETKEIAEKCKSALETAYHMGEYSTGIAMTSFFVQKGLINNTIKSFTSMVGVGGYATFGMVPVTGTGMYEVRGGMLSKLFNKSAEKSESYIDISPDKAEDLTRAMSRAYIHGTSRCTF